MRKTLLAFTACTVSAFAFGQARLVLNNDAWLRIDGGAFVVVENPATNAVTTTGTGGNISSESEFDRIRWQIGTTTGSYVMPFTTPSGVKIPLTYNVTTAGVGTGSVLFSTYNYGGFVPTWDNDLYKPSDVTHMNNFDTGTGFTLGATDESGHVVDRFWIIDTKAAGFNYTTSPAATLSFVYERNEVTAGNTIGAASQLAAQRFNSTSNRWGDYLPPAGTFTQNSPTVTQNTVSGIVIPANQFYRSWTLSDKNNPLPIELTDFRGNCEGGRVKLEWTTASEQDNDYFLVEKSTDAITYTAIGAIDGAGTSVETINYSFVDMDATGLAYYRLHQVDFDGQNSTSDVVAAGCENGGGIQIVNAWDDGGNVQVVMTSSLPGSFDVSLVDAHGKVVFTRAEQNVDGGGVSMFSIPKGTLGMGLYFVRMTNSTQSMNRKVMLQ